jgi:hypothetical protein
MPGRAFVKRTSIAGRTSAGVAGHPCEAFPGHDVNLHQFRVTLARGGTAIGTCVSGPAPRESERYSHLGQHFREQVLREARMSTTMDLFWTSNPET